MFLAPALVLFASASSPFHPAAVPLHPAAVPLHPAAVPPAPPPAPRRDRAATYRLLHADALDVEADSALATGDVTLERTGELPGRAKVAPVVLKADTVSWNRRRISAEGNVRLKGENTVIEAARMEGAADGSDGRAEAVRLLSGPWIVLARDLAWDAGEAEDEDAGALTLARVVATTCDYDTPHYTFSASRAVAHPEKGWLSLRNVTMRIGRLPVFWFPWLGMSYGENRTPLAVRVGQNHFEGTYVKTKYRYRTARFGGGEFLLDYRSRKGWAGGVAPEVDFDGGGLEAKLYRLEERDRGGRGEARAEGEYAPNERLRFLGHVHRISDLDFRRRFLFEEFVTEEEPQNDASAAYRGRNWAGLLRVVGNLNRTEFDVLERLPEGRVELFPYRLGSNARPFGYLSGTLRAQALRFTDRRGFDTQTNRYEGRVRFAAPVSFGRADALRVTPHLEGTWTRHDGSERTTGEVGLTLSTMRAASWMPPLPFFSPSGRYVGRLRPALSLRRRASSDWTQGGGAPLRILRLDDFDPFGEAREVVLTLDHDVVEIRPFRRLFRTLVTAGYDDARSAPWKDFELKTTYSPTPGFALTFDGALDPNENVVRRASFSSTWRLSRGEVSASLVRANGEAGEEDLLSISASARYRFTEAWEGEGRFSFDGEEGSLDYASVAVRRYLHDFVLEFAVADEARADRTTVRFGVGLRALGRGVVGPELSAGGG